MPGNSLAVPGLKAARIRKLLTQEQLAEETGLGRSTLARLETGAPASLRTVRKLADVLEVDPAVLLEGSEGKARAA